MVDSPVLGVDESTADAWRETHESIDENRCGVDDDDCGACPSCDTSTASTKAGPREPVRKIARRS
ncbi:hypothetical protein PC116_g21812 [Phytophthora cactorum]|uniref:Uncharacterized protein n=1 Tax=Phytophthora cactorum TaxID=29920 RepID=A0A8T1CI16_9STRA|nr:hypothetical protein Pcac1_g16403 [Phytophthora cactorum]KAG2906573.1 hypothetical protein PC114_g11087 [Phytophthora cactorum]KAG2921222.1 hypothetical protein PC117_g16294 [Phytophthora cactorum]KAG3005266.1 hypothetical protein PC120_g18088 [Phytophthora cactorum]KAG3018922.1 hypothetical protein PC119_g10476 [Phytophthora cactorum]